MNKFYTDYPFVILGDVAYTKAPIREIKVIDYDGNKYCNIEVNGIKTSIKIGYIYKTPGRCLEVPSISPEDLVE